MKIQTLIIIPVTLLIASAWIYPPSSFIESIDDAWLNGQESEIIKLVDEKLDKSPDNPLALFVGYYYHVFVTCDLPASKKYTDRILSYKQIMLANTTDDRERVACVEFFNSIFPTGTENQVISEIDREKIKEWAKKEYTNEFPGSVIAQMHAKVLANYSENYRTELANNMKSFQESKLELLQEIGAAQLKADIDSIVSNKQNETWWNLGKELWPHSISRFKPLKVSVCSNAITLLFWKLASTYDGMTIYFDETEPSPSVGIHYEYLTNRVYWYHSSL